MKLASEGQSVVASVNTTNLAPLERSIFLSAGVQFQLHTVIVS